MCVCVCERCGSAILLCGLTTPLAVPEEWNVHVITPILCCTRTHSGYSLWRKPPVLTSLIIKYMYRYSLWRKPPVLTSLIIKYMYRYSLWRKPPVLTSLIIKYMYRYSLWRKPPVLTSLIIKYMYRYSLWRKPPVLTLQISSIGTDCGGRECINNRAACCTCACIYICLCMYMYVTLNQFPQLQGLHVQCPQLTVMFCYSTKSS